MAYNNSLCKLANSDMNIKMKKFAVLSGAGARSTVPKCHNKCQSAIINQALVSSVYKYFFQNWLQILLAYFLSFLEQCF